LSFSAFQGKTIYSYLLAFEKNAGKARENVDGTE
jgi:hypothetical protein